MLLKIEILMEIIKSIIMKYIKMSSNENNYFENINYFKAYILGGISCSLCLNNNDILLILI